MNKSKTALLSVFWVNNYGSKLQTYAMQQILNLLGIDNEIIQFNKKSVISQFLRIFNPTLLKAKLNFIYRDFYGKFINKNLGEYFRNRDIVFDEFRKAYLNLSKPITSRKDLEKEILNYNQALVGSDQVWNPTNLKSDYYTMTFVPNEIKKIAYASSFGVSRIPNNQKRETINYLSRINHIGVREIAGQNIIKNLLDRDVPVVADPTLLLPFSYWQNLNNNHRIIKEDYIFCYFLGHNQAHRNFVKQLKIKTGCQIVSIPHCDGIVKADLSFNDITPDNIGPCEFLNLLSNASYVCTDSFHCCIFSILYKKNFYVFNRFEKSASSTSSTNSRIESLLKILQIEARLVESPYMLSEENLQDINYNNTFKHINKLRRDSLEYLTSALNLSIDDFSDKFNID